MLMTTLTSVPRSAGAQTIQMPTIPLSDVWRHALRSHSITLRTMFVFFTAPLQVTMLIATVDNAFQDVPTPQEQLDTTSMVIP